MNPITKKTVAVSDIVIPKKFEEHPPAHSKIDLRYSAWRETGAIPGTLYVDEDMVLLDGYAAYLVRRMVGTETVHVIRVNRNKKLIRKLAEDRDAYKHDAQAMYDLLSNIGAAIRIQRGEEVAE